MALTKVDLKGLNDGTDGQIITYDANGNPVAVGPGTDGQVLTSTGAGSPPAFENNYVHPNHSGEVTSTADGAQVIADNIVDEANLKVDNSPTNDHVLTAKSSAAGGLTWAEVSSSDTLSFRNLIINGAFNIAQRGTSSTGTNYKTVDRFKSSHTGEDEACTQSQISLTSSDTGPWAKGFRKAYQVQNGNQSSGAGADDYAYIAYLPEAQDIANSGWDYTSASSYITLSFWVKSSVAQNFYGHIQTDDGTAQRYAFETGSLSANTWTKITKSIPGNSSIQMDNNNDLGMYIYWWQFLGTSKTDSSSLNTWAAYTSGSRTPDNTSTWWTTNDATWAITGVQLEVGSTATEFEHRSYAEELARCQRYYIKTTDGDVCAGRGASGTEVMASYATPVPLRANPSITHTGQWLAYQPSNNHTNSSSDPTLVGISSGYVTFMSKGHTSIQDNKCISLMSNNGVTQFSAEL